MKIQVTTTKKQANELLNQKETTLWYLLIGEPTETVIINVGEKTYNKVKNLIQNENKQTQTNDSNTNIMVKKAS